MVLHSRIPSSTVFLSFSVTTHSRPVWRSSANIPLPISTDTHSPLHAVHSDCQGTDRGSKEGGFLTIRYNPINGKLFFRTFHSNLLSLTNNPVHFFCLIYRYIDHFTASTHAADHCIQICSGTDHGGSNLAT